MKIVLITILLLILAPGVQSSAKEPTFDERVEQIVKSHKVFTDRLIKAWEFKHDEVNLLAEVIYHENWHTDKDKRAAYLTGAVVMNRVARDDKWMHLTGAKTVHDVVYAKGQYSTTKKFYTTEIPAECYEMAWDIYTNGTPDVPAGVVFQATFRQGPKYDVINGEWFCYG